MMKVWLILGVLGYFSYAISTSIDKYFMNHRYDPVSTNTFKMFFDGIILLIWGILFFQLRFTVKMLLSSILLGGIYAITGIIYFDVLRKEDVEVVVPYLQSGTLLLILLSSVLLFRETINVLNVVGILLILLGVYAVLASKFFSLPHLSKGKVLILSIIILDTMFALLAKKFLFNADPLSLAILLYLSSTFILTSYILLFRKGKINMHWRNAKICISALFGATGTYLLFSALAIGSASKVYAISGLQSVFVFMVAWLFLKERFYWHRIIGILIIVMGIFLMMS